MCPKYIDKRFQQIEARLKRLEDILEISPTITSFDEWKDFSDRDKNILNFLLSKQREGAALSEMAKVLNLPKPDTTGKVIVHRRLKHIEKASKRLKGFPIIVSDRRKWYLNYDDFQFAVKAKK